MVRFGTSSIAGDELQLTLRVENFSTRFCKGSFDGPEFTIDSFPDSAWRLTVEFVDGAADNDEYVVVRLSRKAYDGDESEQLVTVKSSVIDFAGCPSLTKERDMSFNGDAYAREVLSLSKGQLMRGNFGLKRGRFLPGDTLTLLCKLVLYKEVEESFESREEFENSREIPGTTRTTAKYFARTTLAPEKFDFAHRFGNFSVRSCRSQLVSDGYRHADGSEWSLVVYDCLDFYDIKLRRNHPFRGEGQFAGVKLTVVGRLGRLYSLEGKKQAYFYGYPDEETRVLSISKRYLSDWCKLNKVLLMPDDSLTLRCEVTQYEENVTTFDRKRKFVESFEKQNGHWWRRFLSSWMTVYLLGSLLSVVGLKAAYWLYTYVIYPLMINYVIPLVEFAIGVILIAFLVYVIYLLLRFYNFAKPFVKRWYRRIKKVLGYGQRRRRNSRSYTGREIVPYQNRNQSYRRGNHSHDNGRYIIYYDNNRNNNYDDGRYTNYGGRRRYIEYN